MMSIEQNFGSLFKPEIKSSGRKLVAQDKISISSHSDTSVQAWVRVAPPFKVTLTTDDIADPNLNVECNCPVAKKSRFCKHVWATLVAVEDQYPDFLSDKTEIDKAEVASANPADSAKASYAETAKLRASVHRKEQYQKMKSRAKDQKRERKGLENTLSSKAYSEQVEAALAYFNLNGFPMPGGPAAEILSEAKRKLSRVFHPDKGGSHEESVELNRYCEILEEFLG